MSRGQMQAQIRAAQRRAEQQVKREIDRVNRANKKAVDDHNRKVDAHNKREIDRVNRANKKAVDDHNRKAETHNRQVVNELSRRLRASTGVRYTDEERRLAERVHEAVALVDPRDYDSFLSYARLDGEAVARELRDALEQRGVAVWFDAVAIQPGKSQALQMDQGLRKARSGIALLTPAYLAGRFWTERELGALLSKSTLIPVLHNVTFDDVADYSGILPDLAGFTTAQDSVSDIAEKIASAVLIAN